MRSRTFRILFLSFLCLWFGVIVPGHERGQIVLPGRPHVSVARPCCAMRGGNLSKLDFYSGKDQKSKPSREDQKRCAMCQLIATLQNAPPPLLLLPSIGLLGVVLPQQSMGVSHPAFIGPSLGRAPPVV